MASLEAARLKLRRERNHADPSPPRSSPLEVQGHPKAEGQGHPKADTAEGSARNSSTDPAFGHVMLGPEPQRKPGGRPTQPGPSHARPGPGRTRPGWHATAADGPPVPDPTTPRPTRPARRNAKARRRAASTAWSRAREDSDRESGRGESDQAHNAGAQDALARRDCRDMALALDGVASWLGMGRAVPRPDLEAMAQSARWVWDAGPEPEPRRDVVFAGASSTFTNAADLAALGADYEAAEVGQAAHRMAHQLRHMVEAGRHRPARRELPGDVSQRVAGLAAKYQREPAPPEA